MHGPHTNQQLAQVKGKRAGSHGPLEKPLSLAQQKSKQQAKMKSKNKNKVKSKTQVKSKGQNEEEWGNIDWNEVGNRGVNVVNALRGN